MKKLILLLALLPINAYAMDYGQFRPYSVYDYMAQRERQQSQTQPTTCGIPPIPPMGCTSANQQCVCSQDHCEWVFFNCK